MFIPSNPISSFIATRQGRLDLSIATGAALVARASGHKTEAADDQRRMTKLLQATLGLDEKEAALLAFTAVFESIKHEGDTFSVGLTGARYREWLLPLASFEEHLSVSA